MTVLAPYFFFFLLSIIFVSLVCVCKTDTERQRPTETDSPIGEPQSRSWAQKHPCRRREATLASEGLGGSSQDEGEDCACHAPGLVCQGPACWLEEAPHQRWGVGCRLLLAQPWGLGQNLRSSQGFLGAWGLGQAGQLYQSCLSAPPACPGV